MSRFVDITGQTFGRLTVLRRLPNDSAGIAMWFARCACGKDGVFRGLNLRNGHTKSCGCAANVARPLLDRILANTKGGDGCWEWTGRLNNKGYGWLVAVELHGKRTNRVQLAHRAMWFAHHGQIPAGMLVCHRCDNPPCVRPDHLFLGTKLDNARDMAAKGRWRNQSGGGAAYV